MDILLLKPFVTVVVEEVAAAVVHVSVVEVVEIEIVIVSSSKLSVNILQDICEEKLIFLI